MEQATPKATIVNGWRSRPGVIVMHLVIVIAACILGWAATSRAHMPSDSCPGAATEGWESGDLNGWQGFAGTHISVGTNGGNPGKYLKADGETSLGVMASQPPWAADYATGGIHVISVDIKAFAPDLTGPSFRVRRDATVNGWVYVVGDTISADGNWHSFSVFFEPTWSDAEAEAAGWQLLSGPAVTFAETMSNVGYLIINVWVAALNTSDEQSLETLYAGFDNASLSCGLFADGFESGDTSGWSQSAP